MNQLERLLNLVGLLLDSRRPLTFELIREQMEGYEAGDSGKRKFERDKDILRDNGIPIELVTVDPWEGAPQAYTIPKDAYYLPEIAFTPQELSALFLAARSAPEDDASAEQAVRKLLSGAEGGVFSGAGPGPLGIGPDADAGRLTATAEAVLRGGRRVSFAYTTARGDRSQRIVDAWGLAWRAGHWYLVGRDVEREEIRAFRLSRFDSDPKDAGEGSEPPDDFHAAGHVELGLWGPGEPTTSAIVAFSPDVAWWATKGIPEARVREPGADGWVEVTVPSASDEGLASWVLGFGPQARVIAPEGLRTAVLSRLEKVLDG
ncbi:MAG: WYL domain-containing protein [Actinomycetota bacterium]